MLKGRLCQTLKNANSLIQGEYLDFYDSKKPISIDTVVWEILTPKQAPTMSNIWTKF